MAPQSHGRSGLPTYVIQSAGRPEAGSPDNGGEAPDVHTASSEYAGRFSGSIGRWFLEIQGRQVADLLELLPAGSHTLDVGGGHGQLRPVLRDRGHRVVVYGSERSALPEMDAGAAPAVAGDLVELPFASDGFEAVLSVRLLAHVDGWKQLLAEMTRVARRAVMVDYPSRRSVNILAEPLFGLKRRLEGNTRPFRLFAPREVEEAFLACGWRIDAVRPQFLLPMALHRAHGSATLARVLEAPGRWSGLLQRFGSPLLVRAVPDRQATRKARSRA